MAPAHKKMDVVEALQRDISSRILDDGRVDHGRQLSSVAIEMIAIVFVNVVQLSGRSRIFREPDSFRRGHLGCELNEGRDGRCELASTAVE